MLKRNNKETTFAIHELDAGDIEPNSSLLKIPHTYKEILYLKSGKGYLKIDDNVYELTKNTMYFIKMGQIMKLTQEENLVGYSIKYKNEFIPSAGLSYKSNFYSKFNGYMADLDFIKFKKNEISDINNHFNVLLKEYHQPDDLFTTKSIAQCLFISWILKIERKARDIVIHTTESQTSTVEKELYKKFLDLLEENFMHKHDVEFYANELSVSRRKLSEIIAVFYKIPAKKLIINRILLEAKRLLSYSNKSLKEICFDLGFNSPSYFSNMFKEHVGKTPGEFRKSQQR